MCACVRRPASVLQALEKNQQWLAYDHQREAYVRSVLARTVELEQQLAQTSQASPEGDGMGGGRRAQNLIVTTRCNRNYIKSSEKLLGRVTSQLKVLLWYIEMQRENPEYTASL